jgi:hypothetical protein
MKLPAVDDPTRFQGLYVFDFGKWTALGYTADEVALLLESEQYRDGRVYRIERVRPDGHMELRGVSRERFQLESCLSFPRCDEEAARADFAELCRLAADDPPPCRAYVHLAAAEGGPGYMTVLMFPAEYEPDVGNWLTRLDYQGGDLAEGGISHASNYYAMAKRILDRGQLAPRRDRGSRSRDEVYASIRQVVQR